jgi:hypothetical protein
VSWLNWFVRTSGNLIFVPLCGEDASTLRVEVLPIGRATPFESTAPAVVVYSSVAHEVEVTVTLLWSWMSRVHGGVHNTMYTRMDPVMFTEGSRKHPKKWSENLLCCVAEVNWERTSLCMECHLIVCIVVDTLNDVYFSVLVPDGQFIHGQCSVQKSNYVWPLTVPQ